jgi:hypothetical protein
VWVIFVAENDPSFGQIVWSQFNGHFVAREDADVIDPHSTGYVGQDNGFRISFVEEFDPEHSVWKGFRDHSQNFNDLFRHTVVLKVRFSAFFTFFFDCENYKRALGFYMTHLTNARLFLW